MTAATYPPLEGRGVDRAKQRSGMRVISALGQHPSRRDRHLTPLRTTLPRHAQATLRVTRQLGAANG